MELDPVLLSRIQFGFLITFHIIFPAFTIGLAGDTGRSHPRCHRQPAAGLHPGWSS